MTMQRRCVCSMAAALALATLPGLAMAQAYPNKPVRIMVGATAGGGTDILARLLAEKFNESMKQSFIVENKPGAANTLAAAEAAKSAPDGYTLLLATNTGQAIAPHMLKLSFDPLKDLAPVGLVVTVPQVLLVGPQERAKTVAEFVAAMKAKPDGYNYGSSGVGSTQHIAGEALNLAAGTKSKHVPYKGSSAAHIDIIGGQVQFMIDTTSSAMGQIKGGKLRPLAVTTATRSSQLPDVPTMQEAGYPSVGITTWYGLYATGGTPKAVIDKLHAELQRALKLPDVQERLRGLAGEASTLNLEQFAELNRSEFDRYGKLVKAANIKAE
ncbi:MAG TPA: tripartite tricarboxylate transporter substrate binding protein [Burkholderiaceae bacterium]|nr:tripartite tricarboxylate transporter substrate binding protein [Burkholderiaceae bacterium]